ncbi:MULTISPECIES: ATP-binding protein, partial [unclassified Streptomyces]|uniref:AAA family ATPase n=1 Tax=unclassified Streptomyces TaxID=2593676 RepID=UPI00081E080B
MRATASLFDREQELRRIGEGLASAAAGSGSFLVVSGESGMGRSALADAAADDAERRGLLVLRVRGSHSERGLPFGLTRRLFLAALNRLGDEAKARILADVPTAAALLCPAARDIPPPPAGLLRDLDALHMLLSAAIPHCPGQAALIAVDDVQWADEPSLRWLTTLAERAGSLPVMLLATRCLGAEGDTPELLEELLFTCSDDLRLTPLSGAGVAAWLAGALSERPCDSFVAACEAETRGNPLLLSVLAAHLGRTRPVPDPETVGLLPDATAEVVTRWARVGLRRTSADAPAVLRAVALLDGGATPD